MIRPEGGPLPKFISATADVRGEYRYSLTRVRDPALPMLAFVLLNPSTADTVQPPVGALPLPSLSVPYSAFNQFQRSPSATRLSARGIFSGEG